MSKVAILTDSNSGITQAEAEREGLYVVPMPFYINDQMFFEEIDLSQEDFYGRLTEGAEIKTSMPTVGSVTDQWRKLLKDYDEIVYIPMSSGLSSSCETAYMLAKDEEFDGKVFVVDNQRISVTQRQSAYDAKMLADQGRSGAQIRDILMDEKFQSSIYIMVDTLYYLKKGGRISKTVAFAGGVLNIKPVVTFQDGQVQLIGKARGSRNGNNLLVEKINESGGVDFSKPVLLGYTGLSSALLDKYEADSSSLWQGHTEKLERCLMCSVIGTHAGPGAVAVAFFRKA